MRDAVDSKIMYRPDEVAQMMGLGRRTIFTLLRSGELPSVKIGSARLISRKALDEFVQHLEAEQLDCERAGHG